MSSQRSSCASGMPARVLAANPGQERDVMSPIQALAEGRQNEFNATASRLTSRESEVIRLIDAGLSNKEIAQHLYIEVATVKNHVHNILEKLEVKRRGQAAARVRGWVLTAEYGKSAAV
jgi:DNA-binding NarL/FixJ family response regulator